MEWIKNFFQSRPMWKIVLTVGFGLLGLVVVVWLVGFALRAALGGISLQRSYSSPSPSYVDSVQREKMSSGEGVTLSTRNIGIQPRPPSGTIGGDAEAFEATDYSVMYETANLKSVCLQVEALKSRTYVVFENANRGDRNCSYTFKVEKTRVNEIKGFIESLKPETLTESTYTIKPALEDFTSREDILKKKLTAIEDTLAQAQRAYDELRVLATSARDAESLAKVIESKINLIERLTTARLSLREELDRLAQDKALQLDRLDYTYFSVSVYEKLIVDMKALKDMWFAEFQQFVWELNTVLEGVTLGLLQFALRVFQIVLYVVIVLFVAKYGWRLARKFWQM